METTIQQNRVALKNLKVAVLAELPPDEAFALWKQHVLGGETL